MACGTVKLLCLKQPRISHFTNYHFQISRARSEKRSDPGYISSEILLICMNCSALFCSGFTFVLKQAVIQVSRAKKKRVRCQIQRVNKKSAQAMSDNSERRCVDCDGLCTELLSARVVSSSLASDGHVSTLIN